MTAAVAEAGSGRALELGSDDVERRATDATLRCIARHGVGKTTIDDVAHEAGCSRATLYRYFGGRQHLLAAAVGTELDRVVRTIRAAVDATDSLEDAAVAILHTAWLELGDHPALRFVTDFEPERLLPHLTFAGGDRILAFAADALAPSLDRFLGERAGRAAEWIARVGLVLWCSPMAPVSLGDAEGTREYVRTFVLPPIDSFATVPRG